MSTKSDFLVIGAGIAGASAGYYLSCHGKTVVLEKETQPGYHSTGRSAALFSEHHGPKIICRLARCSHPFLDNPPDGFTNTPLLTDRGVLFVGKSHEHEKARELLSGDDAIAPPLQAVNTAQTLSLVPFLHKAHAEIGVFYPAAKEIDVAALHQGFLRGIKSNGGEVSTDSNVIAVTRLGNAWRVKTQKDVFETGMIINAAGAWADEIAAMAGLEKIGLVPKRRTIITVGLPAAHQNKHYPMVISLDQKFYFKTETGSLLASPMDTTPVPPQDAQPEEIDIATAAFLLEERTTLKADKINNSWAGLRTFLPDDAPAVGKDPGAENFIWLAGQGGYGIKTSEAAARCAVSLSLTNDLPQDVKAMGITRGMLDARRTYGEKTSLIA